jgi:transcriptional antiterminator RfaH
LEINVTTIAVPLWYVVHTHSQQEDRADANLRTLKIETFAPRLKERRLDGYGGKLLYKTKPLFPRYIFARFACAGMLSKVCFTRGVSSVVHFGNGPAPVADEIIKFIRSSVDEDGYVSVGEVLRSGDQVMIYNGVFRSLTGIFERQVKATNRVIILLAAVSYQGRIEIDAGFVQRAEVA